MKEKGLSPKTIKNIHGTLHKALGQAVKIGMLHHNPADACDLPFERNTLYINKQLQKTSKVGGKYRLVPTKNGKARMVTVVPTVMTLLRKQKSLQAQAQLLAGPNWENRDNLVFTNKAGRHLAHITVYKHFKAIVKDLGLEHVRFHDLRLLYAVSALECGDDIKTVQGNL